MNIRLTKGQVSGVNFGKSQVGVGIFFDRH